METGFAGLDELEVSPPDENPYEEPIHYHQSLEERRQQLSGYKERLAVKTRLLVQLYTCSWLIFLSIMGTLARLGVEWLGYYPNAPVITNVLWANAGGCFILGFLQEDRALFAQRRGSTLIQRSGANDSDGQDRDKDHERGRAEHLAMKKSLPLYIGLSVGFCGSFTSFSSFMRDLFLALCNDLASQSSAPESRSAGWSVCAVLGAALIEIAVSISSLQFGAHCSELLFPLLAKIPKMNTARFVNPFGVFLGFGCWLGAVFLAIWPPANYWRGDVVFALVFAPIGCLFRFYLSIKLNPLVAKFPLGTFTANIFGTAALGMAYDLQRAPLPTSNGTKVGGGITACQVMVGIIEGFCGCLTTVSTWVAELKSLRKCHAYIYGVASVGIGVSFLVIIIGSLRWTIGTSQPMCAS